jgi:hypothetical protein
MHADPIHITFIPIGYNLVFDHSDVEKIRNGALVASVVPPGPWSAALVALQAVAVGLQAADKGNGAYVFWSFAMPLVVGPPASV